jgi:hypothetical protein
MKKMKSFLLKLPEEVHQSLKEYQIDRAAVDRTKTKLNDLLIEMILSSTKPNTAAIKIMQDAAKKKHEG